MGCRSSSLSFSVMECGAPFSTIRIFRVARTRVFCMLVQVMVTLPAFFAVNTPSCVIEPRAAAELFHFRKRQESSGVRTA